MKNCEVAEFGLLVLAIAIVPFLLLMLFFDLFLFEFLFNAPKTIKLDNQPWKEYQHRLYGVIQGLLEDGVKEGEFPKINPELMFKALGGLFMGLVFMGDKKEPVSEKDVEKLLNQLIADPNYSSK